MSDTPVTTQANVFFHAKAEPLDKTDQVENLEQLTSTDPLYTTPYVGHMVHVKNAGNDVDGHSLGGVIYICAQAPSNGSPAVWRPLFADDGKTFFITSDRGEVFKITATRDGSDQGRLQVTYPVFRV